MTASSIPVGNTGKNLQTWENNIGGTLVHTEATTPTDTTGVPYSESNPLPVLVQSELLVKNSVTASASGNTDIHTPATGKKIRLYFFGYSAGASVTGVLAGLSLEGYDPGAGVGSVFDQQYLVAPGQPYARNIQGGKRYIEGSVNGKLKLNLSAAQTVYVNYELEEV